MALETRGSREGDLAEIRDAASPIDPFGYFPGVASRISGLGGSGGPGPERYAFHGPYAVARSARLRFEGRFEGLETGPGWFTVAINGDDPRSAKPPHVAAKARITLRQLARQDGRFAIACTGVQGVRYAVVGFVSPDGAARATSLALRLVDAGEPLPLVSPDLVAIDPASPLAGLFRDEPATLSRPVCQMCTADQFDEPAYAQWVGYLHEPVVRHRKQWEFVYLLQALASRSCLADGKRGLGFGVGREPIPAALAAHGVEVVATDLPGDHADAAPWRGTGQHLDGVEHLRRPDICPDESLTARVSHRSVDMRSIPGDLRGFDFLWSACALEHLGSIAAGLRFVEDSLACLKPGGWAVHTTEFNLSSPEVTLDHAETVLFRRRDLEALATRLIAAGHEVAPINLYPGDRPLDHHADVPPYSRNAHLKIALDRFVTTSFGLIVRKGGMAAA